MMHALYSNLLLIHLLALKLFLNPYMLVFVKSTHTHIYIYISNDILLKKELPHIHKGIQSSLEEIQKKR